MADDINQPISFTDKQIIIHTGAIKDHLVTLLTGALRIGGAWLAAQGYLSSGAINAAAPEISQEAVGIVMAVAGQLWAHYRVQVKRDVAGVIPADSGLIVIQ